MRKTDLSQFVGRYPERLTLQERLQLKGKWIALELYTPETAPERRIEAIGDSIRDCMTMLAQRGRPVSVYEFLPLKAPFS